MATVQVNPQEAVFYDPAGANAPLTLQFPLSTDWPQGTRVKLANYSDSIASVTFLAQGSDTIANPEDATDLLASHAVVSSQGIIEYMKFGTTWRLSQVGTPKLADQSLALFSFAAYGTLNLSAPAALPGDLGAAWVTVGVFDVQDFVARGVTVSVANSSFAFLYDGIYRTSFILNYQHDIAQTGRQTQLRLYNLTDAVAGQTISIPIGRNQDATLVMGSFVFEVTDANKNKEFVLQMGNGATIVIASIDAAAWQVNAVSEWRGN